jgi:uncharacterized membrane protein
VNSKPIVYIASPYTRGDQAMNVRCQLAWWDTLFSRGFTPIAPLWSHFQHLHAPRPYTDWVEYDNRIIPTCDACLRVPAQIVNPGVAYFQNDSTGADAEVALFESLGKPVFYTLEELEEWRRANWKETNDAVESV